LSVNVAPWASGMTNSSLIQNIEGSWECLECGSDNGPKDISCCAFCETPKGRGLVTLSREEAHGTPAAKIPAGDNTNEGTDVKPPSRRPASLEEPIPVFTKVVNEVEQWAKQRRQQLLVELRAMDQLSYAERRSQLRALQLELHPDKQEPERRTHAQLLFLLVQAKWEHCEGLTLQRPKKDADAKSKQDEAATRQEAFRRRDASWTETAETDAEAEVTSDDEKSQDGEEDEEPLTLHISDLSGHLCTLQVEKRWTLWRVKVELEAASGLRPEQQRLLLGSKDLDDYARLSTYSTQRSISLVLVECLERYYQRALFMKELSSSWKALQYASASLRADKELVSMAMQQNWRAWEYAAPELKNDIDLVTRVLSEDGLALQQMSRSIRANRALVLIAVKQTWRALSFASATLRRDATVVRCALVQDVAAMELAAEELKRDLNFARSAVWLQGMALKYLSPELRADRNLVHLACQKQPGALKHVAPELFEDHDFVRSLKGNSEAPKFFAWNDQQRHQMEEDLFDRHNRVNF